MFRQTITEDNVSLVGHDEGKKVRVVIKDNNSSRTRMFDRLTHRNESFDDAVERIFNSIAREMNTTIYPII